MVPLTGQNTINDMVDRINEVGQEIENVAVGNANAVQGPASSVVDQIMAFSDTTGKNAKAANISPFVYSILDDGDDAAVRATLGLKTAAVLDAATAATANTAVQRDASGNITGVGITATSGFVGNGSQITSLNMGNVASGTLAVANGGTGTTTSTGTGSVVRSASPTFTGAPLSTTASADTNTTQIATTAFVIGQASSTSPAINGIAAVGTSLRYARADHVHPSDTSKVNTSLLGVANGVATLDSGGKVPTSQLPAYVDDVLEYTNLASFPATGETGKIYVALDTNKTYRWSGSVYIYITSGAVDSVAGKTGVVTLVKGDVGLSNVDNTSDANKPVSTAQQSALNLKADIASPALTGIPTAPTAAVGTNTTQLATTAFVNAEIANDAPSKTGAGASGSWAISVTGNAATATKLATARSINGVPFDGTADITIAAGETGRMPLTGGTFTGPVAGTRFTANDWFRTTSNCGWYSETYAGGIYMTDTTYVRTYNGKQFLCGDAIQIDGGTPQIRLNDTGWGVRYLYHDSGLIGFLSSAGNWTFSNDNSGNATAVGNLTAYSDIRLKTDIEVIPDALWKVRQLRGVTYERTDTGERQTGVIAQEVQAVLPEAVMTMNDDNKTLSVAYGNMVGLLIEAIKELDGKVMQLTALVEESRNGSSK